MTKAIERKITIFYRWWRNDGKAVKKSHIEALEERALEIIQRQMRDENTSGELNDNIRMGEKDPEDGVEYRGYWEIQ